MLQPFGNGNRQPVFVTLAERGIIGADPHGHLEHVPAFPVRGPIDIVGAGDAVTANLVLALAAGAKLTEALELAAVVLESVEELEPETLTEAARLSTASSD